VIFLPLLISHLYIYNFISFNFNKQLKLLEHLFKLESAESKLTDLGYEQSILVRELPFGPTRILTRVDKSDEKLRGRVG